jgi:hypothetical protein
MQRPGHNVPLIVNIEVVGPPTFNVIQAFRGLDVPVFYINGGIAHFDIVNTVAVYKPLISKFNKSIAIFLAERPEAAQKALKSSFGSRI